VVDLPKAFEAKRVRPYVRFGWQNYWQEQFAYALTAALLGDVQVASKLLEEWVSQQRDAIGALESGFRDWFDRIVKIKSSM
jgi:hypothetical protein